jgi:pilus assembly protein CpaB
MQNRRGLLFLGLALLLGVVAAGVAQRWMTSHALKAPDGVETGKVIVARVDLSVASSLSERQLQAVEWPKAHVPGGAFFDANALDGRVLRRPIAAGEPVLESALFEAGAEGGLAALIEPNRRAVSVKVDSVIGVAGFVKPGARVDILATVRRIDEEKPIPYSKVILQDVRVLAVDQKLEEARDGDPELVNVVTVEVGPSEAEHLIYAAHEGKLQLALRTPGDDEIVETKSVGVADLLGGKPDNARKPTQLARRSTSVQIIRGSKVEVKTF